MERKYKLVESDIMGFCRVQALKDFHDVKKGEIGGYVDSESVLSQAGNAWIYGNAKVYGNAMVWGNARVYGNAEVYGNARVYGNAEVWGDAMVTNKAKVYDNAEVWGKAEVWGDAEVKSIYDYIVFKNFWSSGRYFTYTRSNNMWKVGCFYGTGEELIKKAYEDSQKSGREYERVVKYVESILQDEKDE